MTERGLDRQQVSMERAALRTGRDGHCDPYAIDRRRDREPVVSGV
jgi:hypothetical protein